MKPNSKTNIVRAIQFTCVTAIPSSCFYSISRGEIDGSRENGTDQDPEQLEPVEKWQSQQGRFSLIVKRRPQGHGKLDHEEQVPPAPSTALFLCAIHRVPFRVRNAPVGGYATRDDGWVSICGSWP